MLNTTANDDWDRSNFPANKKNFEKTVSLGEGEVEARVCCAGLDRVFYQDEVVKKKIRF